MFRYYFSILDNVSPFSSHYTRTIHFLDLIDLYAYAMENTHDLNNRAVQTFHTNPN